MGTITRNLPKLGRVDVDPLLLDKSVVPPRDGGDASASLLQHVRVHDADRALIGRFSQEGRRDARARVELTKPRRRISMGASDMMSEVVDGS